MSGEWYVVLLCVNYNSPRVCEAWVGERIHIINTFEMLLIFHLSLYLMIAECSHAVHIEAADMPDIAHVRLCEVGEAAVGIFSTG